MRDEITTSLCHWEFYTLVLLTSCCNGHPLYEAVLLRKETRALYQYSTPAGHIPSDYASCIRTNKRGEGHRPARRGLPKQTILHLLIFTYYQVRGNISTAKLPKIWLLKRSQFGHKRDVSTIPNKSNNNVSDQKARTPYCNPSEIELDRIQQRHSNTPSTYRHEAGNTCVLSKSCNDADIVNDDT
ncbi:hypothetical protein ANCDUO_00256 [Ancylostoma duodenale]|uniref:Uncharacterized protein n=1 Tax=Ancylostoma duodenale TaxID=51022 RepID=A0A0C2HIJ6_9BILA|nr:hypothetical protein ANCDUO_00256 [Ancylostoma duodenale]